MLGFGLGGFIDGFQTGYGLQQRKEDREIAAEDRKLRLEDRALERKWAEEDRAYTQEERAFQRSERARAQESREAINTIQDEAREKFTEGVKGGTYDPAQFDKFWTEYAMPRMRNELLLQGNIEGADALQKWGDSQAAKEGGRLFSSALFKAQSGDPGGALDDVIKAGKLRGYIAGDFDIGEKDPIMDEAGNLLGYRLTITGGDGNELVQDIALDDLPTIISSFANPEAAWQSQMAARASEGVRKTELEDYEAKKEIDARHSGKDESADAKRRTDAIKVLRERLSGDLLGDGATPFDELSRDEQEELIQNEMDLQAGASRPRAPAPQVIVDRQSGQVLNPPPASPAGQPTGLGTVPTTTPAAASAPGLGSAPAPAQKPYTEPAVLNGQVDEGLAVPGKRQVVDTAAQMLVEGKPPQEVARMLTATGVEQSQWPPGLLRVLNSGAPTGLAQAQ
ncbi:hypothetical protein GCM10007913_11900 [Devosia yakushimensis]|uniref:Uncharacterized protein n=1 Tax=Devosia yakushimensis TaxID=470028 RepID=A0ABQ5UDG5_9HYPH|nr:hypothetical protein [Devosia yakushimensis]GLQ09258.1 hypothetical protein GCM10007913_11900 [Devosia yakushimensis]